MQLETVRSEMSRPRPEPGRLGFGKYFADHMLRMEYSHDTWQAPRIEPFGAVELDPAASALHYAQSVFEGFKAFRRRDGRVQIFRPDMHAARFTRSARRLCIPPVPEKLFMELCTKLVSVDAEWVPSSEGASLYVRPIVFACEAFLGVRPANNYQFVVMSSPVGAYYAEGFSPVRILVERKQVRAAPGGLGDVKTAANYAASLQAAASAKRAGYAQVLWTDAIEHRYVEEVGTMNVFFRFDDEIVTPPLEGTILPGVTRASVIELLRRQGARVSERRISLDEIRDAHAQGRLAEAFGTGTAAVISPIGALGLDGEDLVIGDGGVGKTSQALFDQISALQRGEAKDALGWMVLVT